MNLAELPEIPPGMLAVRIGCRLLYQTANPAAILLMVKPRNVPHQITLSEKFSIGGKTSFDSFHDSHGNAITKSVLGIGITDILYDAIVLVPDRADDPLPPSFSCVDDLYQNWDIVRYTMPSRYCESDKLGDFASQTFGHFCPGLATAQAICNWVHRNFEYRYGSGTPSLSACDALSRGYGVCRDFAHVMVALCRALDLPARYVAGYMPLQEPTDSDIGIDFHAYVEVFLDGAWHVFDPRHNKPHVGRIKIAHGMDAVDVAFATIYGRTDTVGFQVWSYPVDHVVARTGDPVILPF